MNLKDFFGKIKTKLQKNDYSERFLQELKDHAEDATQEKIFKGNSPKAARATTLKNLGDPEKIAKNYNVMTHGGSLFIMYLEGLLFGILSIPLYLNSQNFAFLFPIEPFEIVEKIIGYLVLALVIIGGSYILYSFAFSRYFVAGANRRSPYWLAYLAVLFAPPLIMYFVTLGLNWGRSPFAVNPLMTLMYFVPTLTMAFITYQRNHQGIVTMAERSISKISKNKKWIIILPIYFLAASLIKFLLASEVSINSPLTIPLIPLYVFEFFIQILGGLFFIMAPNQLSLIGSYWIIALLLSLLSLLALLKIGQAYHQKYQGKAVQWPLAPLCFLGLTIPLLFFAPLRETAIHWNVPAENISARIEKAESWPFYHFVQYNDSDHGFEFSYGIFTSSFNSAIAKNDFIIEQTPGDSFSLSNIKTVKSYDLKKLSEESDKKNSPSSPLFQTKPAATQPKAMLKLPNHFSCQADEQNPAYRAFKKDSDHLASEATAQIAIPCQQLTYDQKLIYSTQEPLFLHNLLLSQDQKWALLTLGQSWFNPKEVYFVEL